MSVIPYNKKLFEIIKDLAAINNSIVFEHDGEDIIIRRKSSDTSMGYILRAPKNVFNFDKDVLSIYNYVEFYQFLKLFQQSPEIELTGERITMSENNSKVEYFISNPLACGDSSEIKFSMKEPDIRFNITSKDIDSIVKASCLISTSDKRKKIRITGDAEKINISLVNLNINPQNNAYDKTYNRTFIVEKVSDEVEPYDFIINGDFFTNIPKKDYTIELKSKGMIKASFIDEDIVVDIYTIRQSEV